MQRTPQGKELPENWHVGCEEQQPSAAVVAAEEAPFVAAAKAGLELAAGQHPLVLLKLEAAAAAAEVALLVAVASVFSWSCLTPVATVLSKSAHCCTLALTALPYKECAPISLQSLEDYNLRKSVGSQTS